MSRNFELLQKLGADCELLHAEDMRDKPVLPVVSVRSGQAHKLQDISNEQSHAIAQLVQRAFLSGAGPKAVMFVNVDGGEQPSWIYARTAQVLSAQLRCSVCLVDANLSSPSLHELFGIENDSGLTDALLNSGTIDRFTRLVPDSSLSLLVSGGGASNWEALLLSEPMCSRIGEMRKLFDYIVFQAPPVSAPLVLMRLGQLTDGAIIVLEENVTRRDAARKLKEDLKRSNVTLLGAVLNNHTIYSM